MEGGGGWGGRGKALCDHMAYQHVGRGLNAPPDYQPWGATWALSLSLSHGDILIVFHYTIKLSFPLHTCTFLPHLVVLDGLQC